MKTVLATELITIMMNREIGYKLGGTREFWDPLLDYLSFLETTMNAPVAKMSLADLPNIFQEEGGKLVFLDGDKRKVNIDVNAYTEKLAKEEPAVATVSVDIPQSVAETMTKALESRKGTRIADIQAAINTLTQNINSRQNEINNWFQQIYKHHVDLDALTGVTHADPKSIIEAICAGGFWIPKPAEGNSLVFETRNPVHMSHVKAAASLNLQVTFGKFRVYFDIRNANLQVKPSSPQLNLKVGRNYHPHVSDGFTMCWGNGIDTINRAVAGFDLPTIFNVIKAILTTYNEGSPYVTLEQFHKEQKKRRDIAGFDPDFNAPDEANGASIVAFAEEDDEEQEMEEFWDDDEEGEEETEEGGEDDDL